MELPRLYEKLYISKLNNFLRGKFIKIKLMHTYIHIFQQFIDKYFTLNGKNKKWKKFIKAKHLFKIPDID